MIKPLILILDTKYHGYHMFKKAQLSTWVKDFLLDGIPVIFYRGGSEMSFADRTLNLRTGDGNKNSYRKLRLALSYVRQKYEFDIIFRTNLSSYLDKEKFLDFINITTITYNGINVSIYKYTELLRHNSKVLNKIINPEARIGKKIKFASGAGFFLNKNMVDLILSNNCKYSLLVDDAKVGEILDGYLSSNNQPKRLSVLEEKLSIDKYESYLKNDNLFHYRFKTSDRKKDAYALSQFGDMDKRLALLTGSNP